jgi:predicted protein tyrosine phosphatase
VAGKREGGGGKREVRAKSERETPPPRTPKLLVLSREDAESYEPRRREVCISIFDPGAVPARLSPRFEAVLRLSFDDITEMGVPTDILFAQRHAAAITEFMDRWSSVDRVVLHCNMGVSRSPGVALGLCDLRGWATAELERSHPGWNRLVRSVMNELKPTTRPTRKA